ncbi:MAG: sterol desaturase family protein, partial [Pseudomonadota bacterium]
QGIPFWLIALFAIIAFDFVDYVNHRMMHLRWLWPIHAVHHSDHDLNAFTSFRVHFLEAFFMRGTYIVGLGWMGIPPEAAGIGAVYLMIHNMYVHTNIDWDHGPLNWLIASPRFHQWHHADKPAAYGKNLSNLCPMWDMMFGTYYVPGPCDLPTHTQEVEHASPISLILAPFQMWGRMVRRRFGKAVPLIHSGERN